LQGSDIAGFLIEPIQGEGGIVIPPEGYLQAARSLCSTYGTLMIADEVQTGLGRTGRLFAVNHEDVEPDVLLLGKVLGGGLVPLSALLTSDALWHASQGSTARSPFHTSTFSGNSRACAAGLAALEVLVEERLWERAAESGAYLLQELQKLQARQPLVADVRGRGLMIGIEFKPATRGIATSLTGGVLNRLSHEYMSGLVVIRLMEQSGIMSAPTLNNPNVLRLEPPLNIDRADLDYLVASLDKALKDIGGFTREVLRRWRSLLRARSE
jgi:putrescine aminotransferase